MIWDNFSILRTSWFTLTTCICLDPRKCGKEKVTLTCWNIRSLWEPISEASNISQSGLCFARHKCFSRRQLSGNISGKHKQAGEDSEKHCLLPWVTRPCDEADEMSLSFLVKTSSSNVNNLPYKNCELNWWKTHPGEFAKSRCMERMTRMSSFVFTVIVVLLCASPKSSQARTEGKYVVSNSDLDYPISLNKCVKSHPHDHTLWLLPCFATTYVTHRYYI